MSARRCCGLFTKWTIPEISPIKRKEDIYHPTIVMGWPMEKSMRRAIFSNNAKFAISAKPRERPLIARSLARNERPTFHGSLCIQLSPFWVPDIVSMALISPKTRRYLHSPVHNQGAYVECRSHWTKCSLRDRFISHSF